MGHWDEKKLRIFLLALMKKWCIQLWLFPHGGNLKVALKSQELLTERPYTGPTKRFRNIHMPPHTGLAALRGTAHGGAPSGGLLGMFVGAMVDNLRVAPRVWEPDPFGDKAPWGARLQAFRNAAIGVGPDQLVEARVYIGLDSKATPRDDDYVGGIQYTHDFRPENSVTSADDESASGAFLPIFQIGGEDETLLLPQTVRDALRADAEQRAPAAGPHDPGPDRDADAPRRPCEPPSQSDQIDRQEAALDAPLAEKQASPVKRKREEKHGQMADAVWRMPTPSPHSPGPDRDADAPRRPPPSQPNPAVRHEACGGNCRPG
jgi:hypothetical protein